MEYVLVITTPEIEPDPGIDQIAYLVGESLDVGLPVILDREKYDVEGSWRVRPLSEVLAC